MNYEDPYEIGRKLEAYYEEAEQAVYDRDYQSSSRIYWNLGTLNIVAVDEEGGDPVDMSVEDMKKEAWRSWISEGSVRSLCTQSTRRIL